MMEFSHNDAGYVEWVRQHPQGYVVVSWNPPRSNYLSLHRADCHCIDPAQAHHVENWTHSYIKVCADTIEELQDWAANQFGEEHRSLTSCGHCRNAGRVPA
jgi:hypothetical protein